MQTLQPIFCVSAVPIGTIDSYHFIPLSAALVMTEGEQKAIPMGFWGGGVSRGGVPASKLIGVKLDVALKLFKWTLLILFFIIIIIIIIIIEGNDCFFC